MDPGFLVGLIITLVAFVLISTTIYRFASTVEGKEAEILCHDSIAMRAATALQINTGSKADSTDTDLIQASLKTAPVLCKTIDVKIKGDREEIKRQIAEKIIRCWWMFGEGRYGEALGENEIDFLPGTLAVHNQPNECFNCYNLMIEQEKIPPPENWKGDEKDVPIKSDELMDYLWTHYPTKAITRCTPLDEKKCGICPRDEEDCSKINCQDKEGDYCIVCSEDNDCKDYGTDLKCEKGYCNKLAKVSYLKYIQDYGGPGMFIGITDGIKAQHAYSVSILPKTRVKEQVGWLQGATLGLGAVAATALFFVPGGQIATVTFWAGIIFTSTSITTGAINMATAPSIPDSPNLPLSSDSAIQISIEKMFEERAVSSIYLSETKYGQVFCGSGDLAGE